MERSSLLCIFIIYLAQHTPPWTNSSSPSYPKQFLKCQQVSWVISPWNENRGKQLIKHIVFVLTISWRWDILECIRIRTRWSRWECLLGACLGWFEHSSELGCGPKRQTRNPVNLLKVKVWNYSAFPAQSNKVHPVSQCPCCVLSGLVTAIAVTGLITSSLLTSQFVAKIFEIKML